MHRDATHHPEQLLKCTYPLKSPPSRAARRAVCRFGLHQPRPPGATERPSIAQQPPPSGATSPRRCSCVPRPAPARRNLAVSLPPFRSSPSPPTVLPPDRVWRALRVRGSRPYGRCGRPQLGGASRRGCSRRRSPGHVGLSQHVRPRGALPCAPSSAPPPPRRPGRVSSQLCTLCLAARAPDRRLHLGPAWVRRPQM